eukprot:TRINITY_DN4717_c0_g1_i2.p1 TRINITY_DN4717_c0_g1~~TRINITY_DN4717_c0_g1_i2.p1  ORF type:complete len:546 (-),score=238.92 TRINITY_DN4717_c0_g1_i2:120-1757(-)
MATFLEQQPKKILKEISNSRKLKIEKKTEKDGYIASIEEEAITVGIKQIVTILKINELDLLCKKVPKSILTSEGKNKITRKVKEKRVAEQMISMGISKFLTKGKLTARNLTAILEQLGIEPTATKVDELIEVFETEVKLIGMEIMLGSFSIKELRELIDNACLTVESASKNVMIKSLIYMSDFKKDPNAKPRVVKKKEPKEEEESEQDENDNPIAYTKTKKGRFIRPPSEPAEWEFSEDEKDVEKSFRPTEGEEEDEEIVDGSEEEEKQATPKPIKNKKTTKSGRVIIPSKDKSGPLFDEEALKSEGSDFEENDMVEEDEQIVNSEDHVDETEVKDLRTESLEAELKLKEKRAMDKSRKIKNAIKNRLPKQDMEALEQSISSEDDEEDEDFEVSNAAVKGDIAIPPEDRRGAKRRTKKGSKLKAKGLGKIKLRERKAKEESEDEDDEDDDDEEEEKEKTKTKNTKNNKNSKKSTKSSKNNKNSKKSKSDDEEEDEENNKTEQSEREGSDAEKKDDDMEEENNKTEQSEKGSDAEKDGDDAMSTDE